ncbi:MAG TPA: hypothetical protein VK576_04550, partial [Thermoleophilia bacterium]|nr:hypothetical protein [Thermoleophilia bacterium]
MKSFFACAVLACGLLAAVVGAGCNGNNETVGLPGVLLRDGTPPSPRPGAHVWVVGNPQLVLTSADGGATWTVGHRT